MELTHTFTVPADVSTTWATFMDLREVGGCFPGATVTEVTDDGFEGTVKVKLGPIALVYSGAGSFVERDDAAHRAVIEANGKDKRGNGTAGATVTIQLTDAGDGSTRADVQTDLAVTGKPAQFGRGVMQDVSDKLLGQFVSCIEGKIGAATPAATSATTSTSGAAAAEPAPSPASPAEEPASRPVSEVPGADPAGKTGDRPIVDAAPEPTPEPTPVQTPAAGPAPEPAPRAPASPRPAKEDDALDLGSTVLPVLLKSYGKQVAVGAVVVVAVVVIWRAMSG